MAKAVVARCVFVVPPPPHARSVMRRRPTTTNCLCLRAASFERVLRRVWGCAASRAMRFGGTRVGIGIHFVHRHHHQHVGGTRRHPAVVVVVVVGFRIRSKPNKRRVPATPPHTEHKTERAAFQHPAGDFQCNCAPCAFECECSLKSAESVRRRRRSEVLRCRSATRR